MTKITLRTPINRVQPTTMAPTMTMSTKNWTQFLKEHQHMTCVELKAKIDIQNKKTAVLVDKWKEHVAKHNEEAHKNNEETRKLEACHGSVEQLNAENTAFRMDISMRKDKIAGLNLSLTLGRGLGALPEYKEVQAELDKWSDDQCAIHHLFDKHNYICSQHKKSHKRFTTNWNKDMKMISVQLEALKSLITE
jgi:hypothetical protein